MKTLVSMITLGLAIAFTAPAYSAEIEARGGDALFQANTAVGVGQVREEYATSGQWLQKP